MGTIISIIWALPLKGATARTFRSWPGLYAVRGGLGRTEAPVKDDTMASITLELDLPEGVTVESYQRHEDAHALEVAWPLPQTCTCERCGHCGPPRLEWKDETRIVR